MLYDVEGRPGVSANIDISFCQPIKVGTKIILEGVCSKAGRTLAFLQCRIFNETKEILYSSGTHVKFVQQVPIVNKVSSSAPVHIPKKVVTNFTNVSHPLTEVNFLFINNNTYYFIISLDQILDFFFFIYNE